jgi:hypothetical protein
LRKQGFCVRSLLNGKRSPKVISLIDIDHAGRQFWFDYEGIDASALPDSLRFVGPTFSHAGAELRRVVDMESSDRYLAALAKWLKPQHIRLVHAVGRIGDQLQGEIIEPGTDA